MSVPGYIERQYLEPKTANIESGVCCECCGDDIYIGETYYRMPDGTTYCRRCYDSAITEEAE